MDTKKIISKETVTLCSNYVIIFCQVYAIVWQARKGWTELRKTVAATNILNTYIYMMKLASIRECIARR